jgi:hypothetical protein
MRWNWNYTEVDVYDGEMGSWMRALDATTDADSATAVLLVLADRVEETAEDTDDDLSAVAVRRVAERNRFPYEGDTVRWGWSWDTSDPDHVSFVGGMFDHDVYNIWSPHDRIALAFCRLIHAVRETLRAECPTATRGSE